jgi:hypothetical protein
MDKHKGIRNVAYICQKMSIIGGIVWILNVIFFFIQYFSAGMKIPDIRDVMQSYGGALIAAIVPILMLYAVGGILYLLIDIETNTHK